jgi:opacity protein-like surface antigen
MKVLLTAAVAVLLAIPAAASAAVVPVTSLSGDFGATNSTLRLTPDGVNFGVYPTAESGGSLYYGGANGLTLADVTDLSYTFNYQALHEPAGPTPGSSYTAAPYLRIFLNGDTDDVMLDPPELSWAALLAAHGTDVISGIYITQGFAVGDSFSATVPQMTFNGDTFEFAAPVPGPAGPAGPAGGTVTIVQQPTQLTQTTVASSRLIGNTLRVLHAPKRKGERLVSVRAWLLTPTGAKRLPVDGRAIKVDLRGKPVGNYNVILKSKYRRKDGTVHTVRTTRNLSITPAA